jgi:WD40 repeat protein
MCLVYLGSIVATLQLAEPAPAAISTVALADLSHAFYAGSFSGDCKKLAVAYGGVFTVPLPDRVSLIIPKKGLIKIFSVRSGKLIKELSGHQNEVANIVFGLDNNTLVSTDVRGATFLWTVDGKTRRQLARGSGDEQAAIAISSRCDLVAATAGQRINVWKCKSGTRLFSVDAGAWVQSLAFSPDGKFLAAGQGVQIQIWDVESGKMLQRLKGHSSPVWTMVFSKTSETLYSGAGDATIRSWNLKTGKERFTFKHVGTARDLSLVEERLVFHNRGSVSSISARDGKDLSVLLPERPWQLIYGFRVFADGDGFVCFIEGNDPVVTRVLRSLAPKRQKGNKGKTKRREMVSVGTPLRGTQKP